MKQVFIEKSLIPFKTMGQEIGSAGYSLFKRGIKMRKIAIAGALGWGMISLSTAQAAPLDFVGTTTPLEYSVTIDLFQGATDYGNAAATGVRARRRHHGIHCLVLRSRT